MITLPLIVCLIGLLVYLLIDPALRGGRVLEVGRLMFFAGLIVALAAYAGRVLF